MVIFGILLKEVISLIGVIDVGGGLRGIYGAGVFDFCLDNKILIVKTPLIMMEL